ncbi:hypothetical protein Hanom_Chr16g01426341 [Helianthus anomalus]
MTTLDPLLQELMEGIALLGLHPSAYLMPQVPLPTYCGGPQPYVIPTMEYMDLLVAFLSLVVVVSLLVGECN